MARTLDLAERPAPPLFKSSSILTARPQYQRTISPGTGRRFSQIRNPAGIRAYQKAGFKEIGRRRECRMMGGKLWDEVYMDCLSSEFERPVTPAKDWGSSAWLLPGDTAQIEVGTDDRGVDR